MYYKKFQDEEISALGMGVLRLPMEGERIDREKAQRVLDCALDQGINYLDTAFTYIDGDSERFLGEMLTGRYRRNSYLLSTKFYVAAGRDIEAMFEEQLRRCNTDYFDFYLLHGMDENYIADYMDETMDYFGYLERQKKEGKIRYIGFSSHANPGTLARFLQWNDRFDMAMIQLNYLDWTLLDAKGQYELLCDHGIPVWVMEPLKGGRLSDLGEEAAAILKAAAPERSISSWGFRYLMGLPGVQTILSGMSTEEQVLENAKTLEHPDPLSAREQEALGKAAAIFKERLGIPCSACGYCTDVCPEKLDIPLLMKGFNEYRISGETWRVADLEQTKRGPAACLQCGACRERCPQKIDIPVVLRQFAEVPVG